MNLTRPPIFLFDGACVLCSRSVAFVLKHKRAPLIRFVAIQSAQGRALASHHGIDPIARNRYRLFGKRESCLMPTPETRQRFSLPD